METPGADSLDAHKLLLNSRTDQAVHLMSQDGNLLRYAPAASRANKDIVIAAVRNTWRALQWASETMQGNSEVVLEAVKQDGWALRWASLELRNDRKFMTEVIAAAGFDAMEFAGEEIRLESEHGGADNLLYGASQREGSSGYRRREEDAHGCKINIQTVHKTPEAIVAIRDVENWDARRLRFGGRFATTRY